MKKTEVLAGWIRDGSRVLVLGCGKGEVMRELLAVKKIKVFGIDIDETRVCEAISDGFSVIQGDINNELSDYPPKSFDYIIAHDIIQIMAKPDVTIKQILKLADKVIISFPNFAYLKIRLFIFFSGRMPKTRILPYEWYDTPNIHLFTIKDFLDYCRKEKIEVLANHFTGFKKKDIPDFLIPNLFSEFAYFLLKK